MPETLIETWWGPLTEERSGIHLSACLPLERGGIAAHGNETRFGATLRAAETALAEAGATPAERTALLAPGEKERHNPALFGGTWDGLALFSAPGFAQFTPLPYTPAGIVHAGPRFNLRPLLKLLAGRESFYILALSLDEVRLLEATPFEVHAVPLGEAGRSFAEATGYEYAAQRQVRSSSPAALGRRAPLVHGHGGAADETAKHDLLHYFHRLDEGIRAHLAAREAPLVLATVASHLPLFREASRHPHLLHDVVAGSPDRLSGEELKRRALPLVDAWHAEKRAVRLREAAESGRPRFVAGLDEVLPAASAGRVARLYLTEGAERWGTFDPVLGIFVARATRQNGDEDLLERALWETLSHGGEAEPVPPGTLPDGHPLAALLRY